MGTMTCSAVEHGTRHAYKRRGCRCPLALQSVARYENERRLDALRGQPRTLPNTGALRRLHALRALGWPSRELAARLGVDERNIARWPHRTFISRKLFDAISVLYDELADHPGPDERARRHAARQGWLVPLWWDDDTIDDPNFDPIQVYKDTTPSAADRRANASRTVSDLTRRGWSTARIADHLGCSTRRVTRLRTAAALGSLNDTSVVPATVAS